MKKFALKVCAILSAIFLSINLSNAGTDVTDFPDVLNIKGIPLSVESSSRSFFADRGAWHGYALPEVKNKSFYGGFIGPFLINWQEWLSKSLVQLNLYDIHMSDEIEMIRGNNAKIHFYPGFIFQQFDVSELQLKMELHFLSAKSAIIRTCIKNIGSQQRQLRVGWCGSLLHPDVYFEPSARGVLYQFDNSSMMGGILVSPALQPTTDIPLNSYSLNTNQESTLAVNDSIVVYVIHVHCMSNQEFSDEQVFIDEVFQNPETYVMQNRQRWAAYLRKVVGENVPGDVAEYSSIAVKGLLTLVYNWRSPYRDFLHDGLFPSAAVSYFSGFWAWDSWKHAVALALFDPELAKNQIRAMFDYQASDGMLPDVIYLSSSYNNWRNTKPPLAGWAVWSIYEACEDETFLSEMYEKLVRYHSWWYDKRDHDGDGLCEYGSTDGSLTAAKWESGMDNGARFDYSDILFNENYAYSLNQESVDLNSYLYAEKLYLALMDSVLGRPQSMNNWRNDAAVLKTKIQSEMFDESTGFFYDINYYSHTPIVAQGPEGWIPLWAEAATQQQAESVRAIILDTDKFNTFVPFPTLAADHPSFYPYGYWRGPVWFDQAYFGVMALFRYGFVDDACTMIRKIFDNAYGLKNSQTPIHENYNPLDGMNLKAPYFSWSAAHSVLMYQILRNSVCAGVPTTTDPVANDFYISQNYPNPFNDETRIQFTLPRSEIVRVELFNIMGERIRVLAHDRFSAGPHTIQWQGDNDAGTKMPSGQYFCRIVTEKQKHKIKLFYIR